MDSALQVAGTSADKVGLAALAQVGVVYQGMALLGGGSVLAGMVLGSMAAFIIEHRMRHAAGAVSSAAIAAFAAQSVRKRELIGWRRQVRLER